ncbi:MAG: hypothetical protein Q9210_003013 [Variospora velana]
MDPVTGISLVAAVAQLITFSVDVVKTVREVYEQGSVGRYNNLEYTSDHLSSLTKMLQQSLRNTGAQSPTRELYKLHSRPHSSFLAATRRATRAVWKKPKIEEISKQLDNYRSTLETSLLFRLRFSVGRLRDLAQVRAKLVLDKEKVSYEKIGDEKDALDVVGMAAAEDLTLFICEHLGILKLPGDHITKLPNRSSYSPIYVTLKWLRPIQSRDANEDQTMQKLSSNYREALAGSLRMDMHVDHQLDRAICSPVADPGTQKLLNRAEHALAETYLLHCCDPSSYNLIRSLLHAGANPMAEMDPEHPSGCITTSFWKSWLLFLQRSHSDYLKTRRGSSNERNSQPDPRPEVTFEVTKALIAHGADVNMQLEGSRSTSYRCYLKRRELAGCLFDLSVDATAMSVLAECFSKEPEFLNFTTEMKSVIFTPARRLLFIQPLYVSPARGGSCWPTHWLPPVTVSPEDCELLWPLIEEWENSGHEGDLTALESELGKIWRTQQICTSAEDETLSLADFVMKMGMCT